MTKRILIWTSSYPPIMGGLETVVSQLAEGLVLKGYNVLVLSNHYPLNLKLSEVINNVKIRRIFHSPNDTHGIKGFLSKVVFPFQKWKIQNIIKNFCPDVINIHFPDVQLPYFTSIKAFFPYTKWVASFHGHDILRYLVQGKDYDYLIKQDENLAKKKYYELEQLLNSVTTITTCSDWLANKTKLIFPLVSSVKVIHNAVETKLFETIAIHQEKEPYIFSFGRLDPCKGFEILINAYANLKLDNSIKLPKLFIAGEGIDRTNLQVLIKSKKLEAEILLVGRLSKEEVVAFAKGALINIIPSLREAFGISVLEAIASQKPVLSSNRGGLPEAGGNLVTYFEPTILNCEQKLKNIIVNYHNYLNKPEQIKEYLEKFKIIKMIEKYEFLYQ